MSNMNGNIIKYGLMAAVVGGILYFSDSGTNSTKEDIDLNAVLDITVDTLYSYDEGLQSDTQYQSTPQSDYQDTYQGQDQYQSQDQYQAQDQQADNEYQETPQSQPQAEAKAGPNDDAILEGFSKTLQANYNAVQPALYPGTIGVIPQSDASLLAFDDANFSQGYDEGEAKLFLIEIDGENSRIVASGRDGAVNDHHFSGTSLLTGYLIGSMLSRQRMAGVNPSRLANKKPVTAKSAAKARAGSGSHSKGK